MIPIYQDILDGDNANCMQTVIASLLNEELYNVPNFVEFKDKWYYVFKKYLKDKGYICNECLCNTSYYGNELPIKYSFDRLKDFNGIDGYFFATVSSPKFNPNGDLDGHTHAIIIDKEFNIIHDPKLEYKNIIYPRSNEGYNGIRQVFIFNKINNNDTHLDNRQQLSTTVKCN